MARPPRNGGDSRRDGILRYLDMKQRRISCRDDKLDNGFDIDLTAIMPPPAGTKLATMKTRGEVTLRGKRHAVNAYRIRDRIWRETRLEERNDMPPLPSRGALASVV